MLFVLFAVGTITLNLAEVVHVASKAEFGHSSVMEMHSSDEYYLPGIEYQLATCTKCLRSRHECDQHRDGQ
jgi:hypothetical protein